MVKDYRYQPLGPKEIRLLRLHAKSSDLTLTGFIFHTPLKNPTYIHPDESGGNGQLEHDVPYEAISYHWGRDLAKPFSLVLDNGSVVRLSDELHAILQTVVDPAEEKTVWVDAICINQVDENSTEKEEQIRLMPDIYRIARRVRVHLGRATKDSDLAIQFIHKLRGAEILPVTDALRESLKGKDINVAPWSSEEESSAIQTFWERPWFRRIWVIQEFAYATDIVIYCGNTEVDWMAMYVMVSMYQRSPVTLFSGKRFEKIRKQWKWLESPKVHGPGAGALCFHKMCTLRIQAWGYHSMRFTPLRSSDILDDEARSSLSLQPGELMEISIPSFRSTQHLSDFMEAAKPSMLPTRGNGQPFPKVDFSILLFGSNQYLFSNPKDRFYALLALGTNTNFEEFASRYSSTESVQDVCYRFTVRLLLNGHCSEILSLAQYFSTKKSCMKGPSWVPDWTAPAKNLKQMGVTMCVEMAEQRREADHLYEELIKEVESYTDPTWQAKYKHGLAKQSITAMERIGLYPSTFIKPMEVSENEILNTLSPEVRLYRAAKESKPDCQVQNEKLLIKGFKVDKIIRVLPRALEDPHFFCEQKVRAAMSKYPTGEPLTEVIWRTLIANRGAWEQGMPPHKAPDEYGKDYELAKFFTANKILEICEKEGVEPSGLVASMVETLGKYNLCITRGGYIGLFPLDTQVKDEVAVFHGCDTPFVIRRSASHRDGSHTVIGECYVHGMMQGEFFERPGITSKMFVLR